MLFALLVANTTAPTKERDAIPRSFKKTLVLACAQQKVLCNWGMTLKQSSAVHIQALVSTDVILPGSSSKLRLLVINLASVLGGQLVNSPTAQSPARSASA